MIRPHETDPRPFLLAVAAAHGGVLDPGLASRLRGLVSARDRSEHTRIPGPAQASGFLVTRALARTVLGALLGIAPGRVRLSTGPSRRPALGGPHAGAGLEISLSHAAGYAAVAVGGGEGRVGIDIETAAHHPEVAGRFFSPSELERLERLPGDARPEEFARIWTIKEACAKVTGAGMRSLREIEVGPGSAGRWGDLAWWVIGLPHAMAALARRTHDDPPPAPVWVLLPDLEYLPDLSSINLLDPPASWQL